MTEARFHGMRTTGYEPARTPFAQRQLLMRYAIC